MPAIIHNLGAADGDYLQAMADSLKGRFKGVIVLGGVASGAVALIASVSPEFTAKVQAGKIIQQIAPMVGGKGGGKPDNARGGGKDAGKLDEALAKAKITAELNFRRFRHDGNALNQNEKGPTTCRPPPKSISI